MTFTEAQIESLAPKPAAFKSGKKLSAISNWQSHGASERALWGEIKGSGKNPYKTRIDIQDLAYKCSCPSRQFPCKHALALLLLYTGAVSRQSGGRVEPQWVEEWISKRRNKSVTPAIVKVLTKEEKEKQEVQKEKRQDRRRQLVDAGVRELELWLQDLIRIGLLALPNKPKSEFENVAARMVDAKAPGLAGWVKTLGGIDYALPELWQDEAMSIIGKLYLLLQAWKNADSLTPEWQHTIKNLVGWSQSSKDLMTNQEVYAVRDKWLILGQEEETNDDLVIQRIWLYGLTSGATGLILNFGTRFNALENTLVSGTIIEAELAFFPGIIPHRAIVRLQKGMVDQPTIIPKMNATIDGLEQSRATLTAINPWLNNQSFLLKDINITQHNAQWVIVDKKGQALPTSKSLSQDIFMKWLLITGNAAVDVAVVYKNKCVYPLGIFMDGNYIVL